MPFEGSVGRRRIILFRVFQGQGKKASLAFNSEFHKEDREGSVSLVFISRKDFVLYKWSVSLICIEYSLVLTVLGRLSRVTDIPVEMRKMTCVEMKAAIHQHVTKGNSMNKHVHIQRTQEVLH